MQTEPLLKNNTCERAFLAHFVAALEAFANPVNIVCSPGTCHAVPLPNLCPELESEATWQLQMNLNLPWVGWLAGWLTDWLID